MNLIEETTPEFRAHLADVLRPDEEELIRVGSDLGADQTFGAQWLVVTPERILVHRGHTKGQGAQAEVTAQGQRQLVGWERDETIEIPMGDVVLARTEARVGGACLEIERVGEPTVEIPYSKTAENKFAEVTRGIEQIRQGQPLIYKGHLDKTHCLKCGRQLPEKNGLCPACISRLATLGRIARYLVPYKMLAAVLAFASVATTVAELIPPLITKWIVDDVLIPAGEVPAMDDRIRLLGWLVLAMVGVRLITWGAEWLHGWTITWLSARVTADIRSQLYKRLELLSLQFYDKRQTGQVMARVTYDSGRLQDFLVDGMPYIVINGLMLIGILIALLAMSWRLTLYILVPVPIIIIWGMVFWKRMRAYTSRWFQTWSDMVARVNEALTGIRVVKAFAQEDRELKLFQWRNSAHTRVGLRAEVNRGVFFATMTLFTGMGVVIVWLFGGQEVLKDELTIGTLLAFYSYMWMLYGPLEWFGMVNSWMTRAFAGAERIFEVIDTEPEAYEDPDAVPLPHMDGRITFKNVTFGYDKSKPVLREVELDIKPGEMIGLVGKSGVGKTTTANLICRFYDIDQGSLEIDGIDIRKIRLEDVRGQIGIVLQEPFLFSGTIGENIGYGKPGASFDEILKASTAAKAHEFIAAKPDGYDTLIGERGSGLSGGEKQRISLARAILHNPRILILDEATSSVDVQTEKKVQEAIGNLVEGRTTIAIAHRLSTLRNADRVVVLEGGRVVEAGTHEELMDKGGPFSRLVDLQRETSTIIVTTE